MVATLGEVLVCCCCCSKLRKKVALIAQLDGACKIWRCCRRGRRARRSTTGWRRVSSWASRRPGGVCTAARLATCRHPSRPWPWMTSSALFAATSSTCSTTSNSGPGSPTLMRRPACPRAHKRLVARMQYVGGGDEPECAVLGRLILAEYPAAGDSIILAGCMKLTVAIFSSRNIFVDLYGIDEEEDAFHLHILLGGIMEASSQNPQESISYFASTTIAALDIMQQLVATISVLLLITRCGVIVVMLPCLDLICLRMSGGAIQSSGCVIHSNEQDLVKNCSRTCCSCLSLSYDHHVEDAVSLLFGLCHRRWTTTPPLLILRFNSRDAQSLSSVKAIRYLQLNSKPRVCIPDRPSGEPLAGHQLDCTFIEALEDCRCGNFESGLSTDDRTPVGSICDLLCLLHGFRSTSCCTVRLGTLLSCSTVESQVMLYNCP